MMHSRIFQRWIAYRFNNPRLRNIFVAIFFVYGLTLLVLFPRNFPLEYYTESSPDQTTGIFYTSESYIWQSTRVLTNVTYVNTVCPGLNPLSLPFKKDQSFLKVLSHETYVYSAYYDERPGVSEIRIMGISSRIWGQKFLCQVWMQNGAFLISNATARIHPEGHGLMYSTVFFLCRMNSSQDIPVAVSLVLEKCAKPDNVLSVISKPTKHITKKPFTVCVCPLNFRYNKIHELVEMIEMNRLLGATGFTFYNQNSSDLVQSILKTYIDDGLVQVLNWTLPVKGDTWPPSGGVEIHYFAQVLAQNDCLYRNRHFFKYGVFSDLDELIVPHKHGSWTELINFMPPKSPQNLRVAAYIFRNTFFYKHWPDDNETSYDHNIKRFNITSQLKTKRENIIYRPYQRSKYIAHLGRVVLLSVHSVDEFRPGTMGVVVPRDLGLLHHYRKPMGPVEDWVVDRTMHRYRQDITGRMMARFVRIGVES